MNKSDFINTLNNCRLNSDTPDSRRVLQNQLRMSRNSYRRRADRWSRTKPLRSFSRAVTYDKTVDCDSYTEVPMHEILDSMISILRNGYFYLDGVEADLADMSDNELRDLIFQRGEISVEHSTDYAEFQLRLEARQINRSYEVDRQTWESGKKLYSKEAREIYEKAVETISLAIDGRLPESDAIEFEALTGIDMFWSCVTASTTMPDKCLGPGEFSKLTDG